MNSREAKASLFRYAVRTWHPLLIIDEVYVNYGLADMFVLKPNMQSIEVEVKCSISDLTHNELKKHKYNFEFWEQPEGKWMSRHITNFFYFMLPAEIKDKALEFINNRISFAGVIIHINNNNLRVVKRAKKLHNRNMTVEMFMEFQQVQARKYAWLKSQEHLTL